MHKFEGFYSRLLKQAGVSMSARRAGELAQNMYALDYMLPGAITSSRTVLRMDSAQQLLYDVIHNR